jgi:hypothetical protein
MAKAGKGVRTRQYNPASRGATNLAQYVQAAVDHVRGSHDAAGKILHDTPKAERRRFAKEIWFRRGYRGQNPRKKSLAAKIDSLLPKSPTGNESDFFADLEDRLFGSLPSMYKQHARRKRTWIAPKNSDSYLPNSRKRKNPELPASQKLSHAAVKYESPSRHSGQSCASCAHFIAASPPRCEGVASPVSPKAWCKRFAMSESPADYGYRKFHGRGPDEHYILDIHEQDPYGNHPELFACGQLIRFIVGEGIKLTGEEGDTLEVVEDGWWYQQILFMPEEQYRAYQRKIRQLDGRETITQADVNATRKWLKSVGTPDVAGVPLAKTDNAPRSKILAKQLYIVGGNQNVDGLLEDLGCDPTKELCDLGNVYLIEYFTQKRFDNYDPVHYWHHFGEVSGERPRLMFNRNYKKLYLVGGEYVVRAEGIDN